MAAEKPEPTTALPADPETDEHVIPSRMGEELAQVSSLDNSQADAASAAVDDESLSAQWERSMQQRWTLKASNLSGGNPFTHEIGADNHERLLYTQLNLQKYWPTAKFLASVDGSPGQVSMCGKLGIVTNLLWACSLIPMTLGLWRFKECQPNQAEVDEFCFSVGFLDACAVVGSFMTLPGYVCEILTFELGLARIILCQWTTCTVLLQTALGCVFLSLLLRDVRIFIVWIGIFIGAGQLTFSDAIAVEATTTRTKQKFNVMIGAMPFMIAVYYGLLLNAQDDVDSDHWLRIPLRNETESEATSSWYAFNVDDRGNHLNWSMSCFQAMIFHIFRFVVTTVRNRLSGKNKSVMLRVGLEMQRAERVNVHQLWERALQASKEEQVKIEAQLQELHKQASAAAKAHGAAQANKEKPQRCCSACATCSSA